jgi:hypothetical protein
VKIFINYFDNTLTIRYKKPRILGSKGCMISFESESASSAVLRSPFILFEISFGFFCETFR